MPITLHGVISRITSKFYAEGWGWAVLTIHKSDCDATNLHFKAMETKVTGTLAGLSRGSRVMVIGEEEEHPQYGLGLKASVIIEEGEPQSNDAFVGWMEYRLPNIGPVRAAEIWNRFGHDTWNMIENEPQHLMDIDGITSERADEIRTAYNLYKHERVQIVELVEMGFKQNEAQHLFKRLGPSASEKMRTAPYDICLSGLLPFPRVDAVAQRLPGFDEGSDDRIVAAATVDAMQICFDKGHTTLSFDELVSAVQERLLLRESFVRDALQKTLQQRRGISPWGNYYVMLTSLASAEQVIADFVRERDDRTR